MIQVMSSMKNLITQAANVSDEKLPLWYLPSHEVKFESDESDSRPVCPATWDGTHVVVNFFVDEDKEAIEREMDMWYQLNHPNIVNMFGASHVSSPIYRL